MYVEFDGETGVLTITADDECDEAFELGRAYERMEYGEFAAGCEMAGSRVAIFFTLKKREAMTPGEQVA